MKKLFAFLFVIVLMIPCIAIGEATEEEWRTAPVITHAYEISSGKLYLEWEGKAPVYQVYMDGKKVDDVIVNNAVIPVKDGSHSIIVYPINESKKADTKLELGIGSDIKIFGGLQGSIGIDLATLGLDPQKLTAGNPSATLSVDCNTSTLFDASPEQLEAMTDPEDRVHISFTDRYYSDEYIVSIKVGKDVNHVKFAKTDENADQLIERNKTIVTLILDPLFLEKQECIVPELDNKYTFSVQLRKYAENKLNGEAITSVIHASKESSGYQYTPTAAWKTAPVITYASQTADGQITMQWEHEDYDRGCEYAVMKYKKSFGIKTGEEEMGTTAERSFVVNDLMNGDYAITVVPKLGKEQGSASEDADISIQNDWVVAPVLECVAEDEKGVHLSWTAVEGVENYHIIVYKGDSESLLRFVDLDYSKYAEYDVPAIAGEMEYLFEYDDAINPETGVKFKFELYGIRHAENGEEQKTATSSSSLTLGVTEKTAE